MSLSLRLWSSREIVFEFHVFILRRSCIFNRNAECTNDNEVVILSLLLEVQFNSVLVLASCYVQVMWTTAIVMPYELALVSRHLLLDRRSLSLQLLHFNGRQMQAYYLCADRRMHAKGILACDKFIWSPPELYQPWPLQLTFIQSTTVQGSQCMAQSNLAS